MHLNIKKVYLMHKQYVIYRLHTEGKPVNCISKNKSITCTERLCYLESQKACQDLSSMNGTLKHTLSRKYIC